MGAVDLAGWSSRWWEDWEEILCMLKFTSQNVSLVSLGAIIIYVFITMIIKISTLFKSLNVAEIRLIMYRITMRSSLIEKGLNEHASKSLV